MKYIVKFNEKYNLLDIESFCRNYLAYMLDDPNFTLDVIDKKMLAMCRYTFPTISIKAKEKVKWDDIKDVFIPFINLLIKEYNVYKIEINGSNVKIFNILKDDVNSKSIYKIDILFRENQEKYRKKRDLE